MTSNSKEIKPVVLSIVELCLAGGISQADRQANNSDSLSVSRNRMAWGWSEDVFGLGHA